MGRDAYLDHLATVPLFAACSRKDLQTIARASDEVRVEQGRMLVEEGQPGHEAFVIMEGTARVERSGTTVVELGPGDYFGELALLDGGPRTASVVAATPMTLLVLGQREFSGAIDAVPGLAHKLLAALAARVRELDERVQP